MTTTTTTYTIAITNTADRTLELATGQAVRVRAFGRMRSGTVTKLGRTRVTVKYARNAAGDLHERAFSVHDVYASEATPAPAAPVDARLEALTARYAGNVELATVALAQIIATETDRVVAVPRPAALEIGGRVGAQLAMLPQPAHPGQSFLF